METTRNDDKLTITLNVKDYAEIRKPMVIFWFPQQRRGINLPILQITWERLNGTRPFPSMLVIHTENRSGRNQLRNY